VKYFVTLPSGRERQVDILHDAKGRLVVLVDGELVEAEIAEAPKRDGKALGASSVRVDGQQIELFLEEQTRKVGGVRMPSDDWGVVANGRRFFAKVESERSRIQAAAKTSSGGEGVVRSPMPGRVVRVLVKEGDAVAAGHAVVVVEAMKMENELASTLDGVVKKVHVAAGATVEGGAILVEIVAPSAVEGAAGSPAAAGSPGATR
jgi:glutaconyl-CoA/methylmalonyl-CoA decarboxylase subunit gamma